MNKTLTYFEFWKQKGQYGEIRIQRMLERKQKRYDKITNNKRGSCTHFPTSWHSCPFQEDINNNYDSHYCKCCSKCRHECAMDI